MRMPKKSAKATTTSSAATNGAANGGGSGTPATAAINANPSSHSIAESADVTDGSTANSSGRRRKKTIVQLAASPTPPPSSPAPPAGGGATASAEAAANADYRVSVFGAGGVGKSSIILRFIKNTFSETYTPTIEDVYQQVITCNQKNVCTLHIIDTTGSHQFPAMQRLSIAKGHAFVIVYAVTSRQSLEELAPIIMTLKEVKGDQMADLPIMLVGNKSDDSARREVSTETGAKLAERWGCGFVETSAKNNENITQLFQSLLAMEKRRNLALSAPASAADDAERAAQRKRCSVM